MRVWSSTQVHLARSVPHVFSLAYGNFRLRQRTVPQLTGLLSDHQAFKLDSQSPCLSSAPGGFGPDWPRERKCEDDAVRPFAVRTVRKRRIRKSVNGDMLSFSITPKSHLNCRKFELEKDVHDVRCSGSNCVLCGK